jgi:hypothetical protein
MNPAELLAKLPSKPIPELLASLARGYDQSDDPARPRLPVVILHLRSGRDLSGRIVRLGQDPGRGQTLLLQAADSGGRAAETAALYVPLDSVEAVTVLEADQYADLLSDGALPAPPSNAPAPSRLDVLRAAEELNQAFVKQRGAAVKLDVDAAAGLPGEDLRSLSVLVKETFAALSEIASDPLGRESMAAVRTLKIADAAAAGARLSDGCLEISAALSRGRAGRLSKDELKSRIASLL